LAAGLVRHHLALTLLQVPPYTWGPIKITKAPAAPAFNAAEHTQVGNVSVVPPSHVEEQ